MVFKPGDVIKRKCPRCKYVIKDFCTSKRPATKRDFQKQFDMLKAGNRKPVWVKMWRGYAVFAEPANDLLDKDSKKAKIVKQKYRKTMKEIYGEHYIEKFQKFGNRQLK